MTKHAPVAFFIIIVIALPGPAAAQAGKLGVFADTLGLDCNIVDDHVGELTVHVVHIAHGGAGKIDFMIEKSESPGFGGIWVSDTKVFQTTIGNSQTGVSVIYGGCVEAPTHVLTITYQVAGVSDACSYIQTVENPNLDPPSLSYVDCIGTKVTLTSESSPVNSDGTCGCIVPVEETTWSRIKALYRRP